MLRYLLAPAALLIALTIPATSYAACTSPAGDEGDVIYNTDHKVVQFCDSTNWIGMAGGTGGGGGGGTPGGADTQIQFNDGGVFGGDADMTWDKTGNLLDITGSIATNRVSVKAYTGLSAPTGGSTAQWDTNGTDVWRASGNVGVGTANPAARLSNSPTAVTDGTYPVSGVLGLSWNAWASDTYVAGFSNTKNNGGGVLIRSGDGGLDNQVSMPLHVMNNAPGATLLAVRNNGNVGIGTTSPGGKLQVAGTVLGQTFHSSSLPTYGSNMCRSGAGAAVSGFYSFGDCTSDRRLKQDIRPLGQNGIDTILQLKPVNYKWKDDPEIERAGFIAQDVLPIIPEAVPSINETTGMYIWDANALMPYAVKAIQELKAANDELRAEFEAYKVAHP